MMNVALSVEPGARSTGYRALRYSSQAFLRYDQPIRCRVAKTRVSGGTLRIRSITCAILNAFWSRKPTPDILKREARSKEPRMRLVIQLRG